MKYQHIRVEIADGVCNLTFDRPDKLNALTYDSYGELERFTREVSADSDVHVVVLRGAGRAFCAGGDVHSIIGDMLPRDMRAHLEFTRMTGAVVQNLRDMNQPVIAAVHGTCVGAGSVIALASDLRICAQSAKFGFLFAKVGLTGADMGAAYLLPRIVGAGRASELLLFGDTIDADEAYRIGLANRVVADDALEATVTELAQRLARGPVLAQNLTKRMIQRELDMDLASAIEAEAQAQALMMMGGDHAEFFKAWTEKRPAQWKGR
jgi:enoyl-CoA hydratase/carnithine racemase